MEDGGFFAAGGKDDDVSCVVYAVEGEGHAPDFEGGDEVCYNELVLYF